MDTVHERVVVANETACREGDDEVAVVHACKSPCHQSAVGYRKSLPKEHPNYLWLKQGSNLYLNIIDPPIPLFPDELFATFLSFARETRDSGKALLIHCNQGESRAPTLALVFLAKHLHAISNQSYSAARQDFAQRFPRYLPGRGIQTYMHENWSKMDDF